MKRLRSVFKLGICLAGCRTMAAYLDPGSGSLIVQILVAIIVGALATFRFWKARLLSLFGLRQDGENDDESDETENNDLRQP
ncbi:MAG: hypothetical protein OXG84_16250 [Chloroflexi bacterium]|nr:hypothetical protein [Chloroflexota bacterium]